MRLRSRSPIRQSPRYSPSASVRNARQLRGRQVVLNRQRNHENNSNVYTRAEYRALTKRPSFQHPDVVVKLDAKDFTLQYVRDTALKKPLLFTNQQTELGLSVPNFDYTELREHIPVDHQTEVFNQSKERQTHMKVKTVIDELEKPEKCPTRKGPYTTWIELSYLPLGNYVIPPRIVRQLNWALNVFPHEKFKNRNYSNVERYLLMQMAGSFVDFHIELTGTTTWYHLQKGRQFYFLIPPTDENIEKLREWRTTNFVGIKSTFFGTLVRRCVCVQIEAGQTLIVPSGWIHAVYMPVDCLVYAGNFLHEYSIEIQLKVRDYEQSIQIGENYEYEFHDQTLWYYVAHVVRNATGRNYVRLIHSSYQNGLKTESGNRDCFDLVVDPPEFYDQHDQYEPTQFTFDPIDKKSTYVPPNDDEYNYDYLDNVRLLVRFFWRKLLVLLSKKLELPNPNVAEGIRRPHHLLLDLENLLIRLLNNASALVAKCEDAAETPDLQNDYTTNTSIIKDSEQLPSTSSCASNGIEPPRSRSASCFSTLPTNNELSQQMWALREQHYDCTLQAGKTQIGISKYVFMCKSYVFKQDIINSPTLTLVEFDCTAPTLCAFARWLYFEQVDDLDSCADELFTLACRYDIQKLKDLCTQSMAKTLNDKNFPSRLVFAFTNNDESLKQRTLEYAKKTPQLRLFQLLSASPVWSSFSCTNGDLSRQISEIIFPSNQIN